MHEPTKSERLDGAGPFTFESPELDPGEAWRTDLTAIRKGKLRRFVPFDTLLVKNYDTGNRIIMEINGQSANLPEVDIDPSGKDSYEETPIRLFRIINKGTGTIAAGNVTVSVKRDPYGSDDAARAEAMRGPLTRIIRNNLGL
jgi:hypothetical protein